VKTYTLGAFVGNDVICIHGFRCLGGVCVNAASIQFGEHSFYGSSIGEAPLGSTFINRVVGALRLTGAAVDALVGNLNCHICLSVKAVILQMLNTKIVTKVSLHHGAGTIHGF
jgi:hypothetical protein